MTAGTKDPSPRNGEPIRQKINEFLEVTDKMDKARQEIETAIKQAKERTARKLPVIILVPSIGAGWQEWKNRTEIQQARHRQTAYYRLNSLKRHHKHAPSQE